MPPKSWLSQGLLRESRNKGEYVVDVDNPSWGPPGSTASFCNSALPSPSRPFRGICGSSSGLVTGDEAGPWAAFSPPSSGGEGCVRLLHGFCVKASACSTASLGSSTDLVAFCISK